MLDKVLRVFAANASPAASASPSASASASAAASSSAESSVTDVLSAIPTIDPLTPPQDLGSALEKWVDQTFSLGLWGTLIYGAVVALITHLIIKLMQRTLRKKLYGNLHIFYRLLHVLVVAIGVICVLLTITPLKDLGNALLASSGLASVIVGLAAQESLANLFAGISIAISKPFIVGDFIEILSVSPTISGTVTQITLRSTVIRDATNKDIVVPNSVIDQDIIRTPAAHAPGEERSQPNAPSSPAPVTNFLDVGVAYTADVKKAMEIMASLAEAAPQFVDTRTDEQKEKGDPAVTVRVQELAASSVNLRAMVPTHTVAEGFQVLSDLRLEVLNKFAEAGIEIPYPYENVILQQATANAAVQNKAPDQQTVRKQPSQ